MVGNQKFLQHVQIAYTKYCEILAIKKPSAPILFEDVESIPIK